LKINNEKRVFIGIPIGPQIKSILPIVKSAVNCNPNCIKWIPAENIHLTLSFLGNIRVKDIPHLIESLEKKITSNDFQLTITGTGVFPSSKSPKVLWLGISKGIVELTLLQSQVEKSVREFKDNYENNTFTPHISIARIRRLHAKIDVLPFLNSVYSPIELDVNSICLYESQLFPEGAQYTVLETFPLN
jgi:2'-5' RNA ligase